MAYYQTTIKSVGAGYAVDVQGKTLKFIGNLPCEEGDTVWTDGNVIFGNVAVRSTPLVKPLPRGIPVVADWVIANDNTCGYFNQYGKFKKKRIAEDNWVVNANRTYRHDSGNILDAEIAMTATGAEDGLYVVKWADENQTKYVVEDNALISDGEIIIEKDGQRISSVTLSSLAADLIEKPIKKELDDGCPLFEHDEDKVSTSAELKLFHIDPDGKWTAIIKFECEAKRKTEWVDTSLSYYQGTIEYRHEYIPIPDDSNYRENLINNLAGEIRDRNISYGFLLNEGETLEECLNRISLGVAIADFFHTYSRPCTTEIEYLHTGVVEGPTIVEKPNSNESYIKISRTLKVTSDNINNPEIVSGNKAWVFPYVTIQRASTEKKAITTTAGYPKVSVVRSEPVTEQETIETFILSHMGIGMVFHDKQKSESIVFYDTLETIVYKPRAEKSSGSEKEGTSEFTFPLQDGYYQKVEELKGVLLLSRAVYDSDGSLICTRPEGIHEEYVIPDVIGILSVHNNFMITPLGRGSPQSYLLGQHNGVLYRVTGSQFTSIGSGLKNFRLREMRNINKAKR